MNNTSSSSFSSINTNINQLYDLFRTMLASDAICLIANQLNTLICGLTIKILFQETIFRSQTFAFIKLLFINDTMLSISVFLAFMFRYINVFSNLPIFFYQISMFPPHRLAIVFSSQQCNFDIVDRC